MQTTARSARYSIAFAPEVFDWIETVRKTTGQPKDVWLQQAVVAAAKRAEQDAADAVERKESR
jgi:hypothetical protein